MKFLHTIDGRCPVAEPGDPPCNIEVESQWTQRPIVHLAAGGHVLTTGYRDLFRENGRYCTTHKHIHHIPGKEQWQ